MTVYLSQEEIAEQLAPLLPGETVLASGLFEAYGALTALGAGGPVGGVAGAVTNVATSLVAREAVADAQGEPQWTLIAVTADHIYAFDVSGGTGLMPTKQITGSPYATWDRSAVEVHVSKHVTHFTFKIVDPTDGRSWAYTGNRIYAVEGKLVAHLLTDG